MDREILLLGQKNGGVADEDEDGGFQNLGPLSFKMGGRRRAKTTSGLKGI
jgi:hypothetical protein